LRESPHFGFPETDILKHDNSIPNQAYKILKREISTIVYFYGKMIDYRLYRKYFHKKKR